MKHLDLDLKYLIILWIIFLLAVIFAYAHQGNLIIDCGREVYIPTQILSGKLLYKDVFNIYGPFSYMFNAGLFKTFGINLNVLYLSGCICAFVIVSLIYKISREFLSQYLSFAIGVFTITTGVLAPNLFNYIFPYSYGMLYGLVAFLISIWFLLKYEKKPDETISLYTSCLFAGLCIASKYDFIPFVIVILYASLRVKRLNFKELYYTVLTLLFVPAFCFGILLIEGVTPHAIIHSLKLLKVMAGTQTLKYFYQTQGVYFHPKTIGFLASNFIKTLLPLALFLYGLKSIRKITHILILIISLFLIVLWTNPASFAFLPILILILTILRFKDFGQNRPLAILTLSAITLSLKSFWGLATLNYGLFFISFELIALFALTLNLFKDKNINQKPLGIYILIIALIFGLQNFMVLRTKTQVISSKNGQIYTDNNLFPATTELINYINTNTKNTDTIAIYPEGSMINFLTNRKSDDYFTSLIPLYIETFGEENIIKYFDKHKPNYIIFNNWDTSNYYFHHICNDYAIGFCGFVATNYTQKIVIDKNGFRYLIFKRND